MTRWARGTVRLEELVKVSVTPGSSASSVSIRAVAAADEAAILGICLKTSDCGRDGAQLFNDGRLPGLVWALPYARLYPSHAFVLTQDGEVMGYCVATPDTAAYEARLEADWWPDLRAEFCSCRPATPAEEGLLAYIKAPQRTAAEITDAFPAHLHINILPQMQKGGHGSRLLRHQLEALRAAGVGGVHLGIDPRNESVTAFYRRFGFTGLGRTPSIVMGMKLEAT